MAWGDTEGGFAQGPHGGVMGGMAGGASSPGEVSDANQAEAAAAKAAKNANALAAAVKSILNSQEYRELKEKEQKEATKKAIEGGFYSSSYDVSPSAVIGAYQDDPLDGLFDTNFNLNIEAPVGLSPGYQGAVTPGVSPPSVSHDFEGLIGQQENESPTHWGKKDFKSLKELDKKEEALKVALGVNTGLSPSKTNREKYEAYLKTFPAWAKNQREKIARLKEKIATNPTNKKALKKELRQLEKDLNKMIFSDEHQKAVALKNPWGKKALGALTGLSPVLALENMLIDAGHMGMDRTPQDILDEEPEDFAPEGQTTEEQITDLQDSIEGGFWGLLGFAKKNPKIFGPLSGDELWKLVMDEDAFWNYYEQGLLGE